VSAERVRKLCETAHRNCFVANSLRSQISVEPTVEFAA
jgi:organic hydroperoxide reductase OsmC/OhrA